MKRLAFIITILVAQHLAINIQNSFAQLPNDNISSGNCLDFDGVDDYVGGIGNTSSYAFVHQNGVFTLESWVQVNTANNPAGSDATWLSIFGNNISTSDVGFVFGYLNISGFDHQLLVQIHGGGADVISAFSPVQTITDTKWHHVAAVGDGTNVTFYVDGVMSSGSGTMSGFSASNATNQLEIGSIQNSVGGRLSFFDGQIDDVRLWNVIRTQTQIQDNMSKKLIGNEAGLVGYWNMNEGSGATVNDLTSNANHGTRQ